MFAERSILGLRQSFGMTLVIKCRFRGANGLHKLRAGAGGLTDDVQWRLAPVRRHLAPAGAGIVFGADALQAACRAA